jgi:hypothetical protein
MHGDGGGLRTVIDEAIVRTPNFAPDGPRRPAQTQLCTAVGRHLLARRKSDWRGRRGRDGWHHDESQPAQAAALLSSNREAVALADRGWYCLPGASAPLAPPRGGAPLAREDGGDGRSDHARTLPEIIIAACSGDRSARCGLGAERPCQEVLSSSSWSSARSLDQVSESGTAVSVMVT